MGREGKGTIGLHVQGPGFFRVLFCRPWTHSWFSVRPLFVSRPMAQHQAQPTAAEVRIMHDHERAAGGLVDQLGSLGLR